MNNRQLITRPGALQAPQLDYFLIDGSGSMANKWGAMLNGLDVFMNILRARNINSHGIVQVFEDHHLSNIKRDSTIEAWPLFALEPISCPGGMTPLFDAINLMARALKDLDPPNASIVIVTDGDENASQYTNAVQAKSLLDWCRAKGWQVTFLGCDFNNDRQAKLLGSTPQNTIAVRKEMLKIAGKTLGDKRVSNVIHGTDINFTDDEKEDFGGYLTHG